MATKTIKHTVCDHHLTAGEEVDGQPRVFPVNGSKMRTDLCDDCYEATVVAIKDLIATRKAAPRMRRVKVKPKASVVRQWARDSGLEVPDRGRIPDDVTQAYLATQE